MNYWHSYRKQFEAIKKTEWSEQTEWSKDWGRTPQYLVSSISRYPVIATPSLPTAEQRHGIGDYTQHATLQSDLSHAVKCWNVALDLSVAHDHLETAPRFEHGLDQPHVAPKIRQSHAPKFKM